MFIPMSKTDVQTNTLSPKCGASVGGPRLMEGCDGFNHKGRGCI